MSIVVTGAAGFIGSNFVLNWLKNNNEKVIALDKLTYAGNLENLKSVETNPNYVFVKGDIEDSKLVAKLLQEHQPHAIVNFAAESHVDRSIHGPDDFMQTNIIGTYHLLEEARSFFNTLSENVKKQFRFLHVSTDEVYGTLSSTTPAFKETNQYEPNSPYSASKAASDHLVRAWHHTYGLPVLTTNCSNNYGPYHFPEKLIPLVLLNALNEKPLPIYGDGQQVRDWLYVTDHCQAIYTVLTNAQIGENYTIGGNTERSNLSICKAITSLLDTKAPNPNGTSYAQQITLVTDRPGHDFRYATNTSKIKKDLGWQPQESFESALEKTVDHYLEKYNHLIGTRP